MKEPEAEERIDALADLRIIRAMILRTRHSASTLWRYCALWGFGGLTAAAASGLLSRAGQDAFAPIPWTIYLLVGTAVTIGMRAQAAAATERSFADRIIGMTWIAVTTVVLILFLVVQVLGIIPLDALAGLTALVVGIGVFVTGAIIDWRPLTVAAIFWWTTALAMLLWPRAASILGATVLVLGFLAPAWVLKQQSHDIDAHVD